MKTRLLKSTRLFILIVSPLIGFTQTYDFSTGTQSWVKGYGDVIVAHDATGGVSMDGALTLERAGNGNANVRRGQGGDDTFVVLDRATVSIVKIRLKNETAATQLRIQGLSRADGTTGEGTAFSNIAYTISAEMTEYQTIFIDVTSIPENDEVTRLDILIRENQDNDGIGTKCIFDEIEFQAAPTTTYSTITSNPSFEDAEYFHEWTSDTKSYGTSEVVSDENHGTGTNSLKLTATDTQNNWWATTNNNVVDLGQTYGEGTVIETKLWLKSNINGDVNLFVAILDATNTTIISKTENGISNTSLDWQEVTYTFTLGADKSFSEAKTRISFPPTNAFSAGNIIYVDDMTTTITPPAASTEKNTLTGVNIYPNPAKDDITINAPENSYFELYDMTGLLIKSAPVSNSTTISVNDVKSGIYFAKISNAGKTSTIKIVIE